MTVDAVEIDKPVYGVIDSGGGFVPVASIVPVVQKALLAMTKRGARVEVCRRFLNKLTEDIRLAFQLTLEGNPVAQVAGIAQNFEVTEGVSRLLGLTLIASAQHLKDAFLNLITAIPFGDPGVRLVVLLANRDEARILETSLDRIERTTSKELETCTICYYDNFPGGINQLVRELVLTNQ